MITESTNCFNHPNVITKWACDRCYNPICENDHKTKGPAENYQIYCLRCYDTVKFRNRVIVLFVAAYLIALMFGWAATPALSGF